MPRQYNFEALKVRRRLNTQVLSGDELRALRKELGDLVGVRMTQESFGQIFGWSNETISRWERESDAVAPISAENSLFIRLVVSHIRDKISAEQVA